MKLRVAITGSIGSGKSSFCNILKESGFPVISADDESKIILANNKKVRSEIILIFGEDSFKGEEINKKYLAEKIFSNPLNVVKVNSILHPYVIEKVDQLLLDLLKTNEIAFVEAALIYEADMESLFDYVVLITADEKIRKERKLQMKMTEVDFISRNANQIPDEQKINRADFVFTNNDSLAELEQKANLLILTLKGLLKTK